MKKALLINLKNYEIIEFDKSDQFKYRQIFKK